MCSICSKRIPAANVVSHEAHCSKTQVSPTPLTRDTSSKPPKKSNSSKQRKSRKAAKPKSMKEQGEEDLDALLAEMVLSEKVCGYQKCKSSTNLLGLKCSFCHRMFCVEHSIPEVHGCGEAAKGHARKQFKKSSGEIEFEFD